MPGTWPTARNAIVQQLNGVTIGALLDIEYDTEASGPFVVGEVLTFSGGATALHLELTDDGATGTLEVELLTGATPAALETITGGTSGATAAVTSTPSGDSAGETLTMFPYAPRGRQGVALLPYGYVIPLEFSVDRYPGKMRKLIGDVVVRVFLQPAGVPNMNRLQKRYDAWVVALLDAWDDAASLDGAADISVQQSFGGIAIFTDIDQGWGFEMTLGQIEITEQKDFSP